MNYAEKWARHMEALKIFVEKHGHVDVPSAYSVEINGETVFLGPWVSKIRGQHRRGKLLPHRIVELEEINGWYWERSKSGPRVKNNRDEEIKTRYLAGESARDLAKEMKITTQRINQIVKGIKK